MSNSTSEHDLLFGLLGLQNGLINQVQLVAAFQAWTLDKSRSLADHLEARGDLTTANRALLEALAAAHLDAHGGNAERSLASIPIGRSTRESLARLGDPEIGGSLGYVGRSRVSAEDDDVDRTTSYAVGSATSDGQRFRILRPRRALRDAARIRRSGAWPAVRHGGATRPVPARSAPEMTTWFADTFFFLALASSGDPAHDAARALAADRSAELLTTSWVLNERPRKLYSIAASVALIKVKGRIVIRVG